MLRVQWVQPKIGPLLRGERDKRFYMGLFSSRGYVRGVRKWALLASYPKADENDAAGLAEILRNRRGIAVFQGMEGMFEPLLAHQQLICRRLEDMLTPAVRRQVEAGGQGPYAAMHVRRGETALIKYGEPFHDGPGNSSLPIDWFANIARQLFERSQGRLPIRVFSDGSDAQLEPLLKTRGVELVRNNSSIVDILHMARARLLVPTSNSTFSMWSAYLGKMPTLWYPGKSYRLTESPEMAFESDLAGNLPDNLEIPV